MTDTTPKRKRGRPAKRSAKKSGETVKKASNSVFSGKKPPDNKKHAAWQLRRLGYTIEQTAQILSIGTTTVKEYDKAVDKYFESMPAVRTAADAITTKIPDALRIYDICLGITEAEAKSDTQLLRIAADKAKDILISTKALKDRQTVEVVDNAGKSDSDLVAEAERILAITGSKGSADADNG